MNKLNDFDKLIKDSLEDFEMDVPIEGWENVSNEIGKTSGTNGKWKTASIISLLIVVGSLTSYFLMDNIKEDKTQAKFTQRDNKDVEKVNIDKQITSEVDNEHQNNNTSKKIVATDKSEEITKSSLSNSENSIVTTDDFTHDEAVKNENHTTIVSNSDPKIKNNSPLEKESNSIIEENNAVNNFNKEKVNLIAPSIEGNTIACVGETIELIIENPKSTANYTWSVNGNVIGNTTSLNHQFTKPGVYDIQLQKEVDHQTVSSNYQIEILEKPKGNIMVDEILYPGLPCHKFSIECTDCKLEYWDFEKYAKSDEASPEYTFNKKGNYSVRCNISNEHCSSVIEKEIVIENDYNLWAPAAFSLTGTNPYWIPEALKERNVQFVLSIYDRSGKLIYQTEDAYHPWDGKYKDGQIAPTEKSYVWVVELTNEKGQPEKYMGTLSLWP